LKCRETTTYEDVGRKREKENEREISGKNK
jgi:hypothetical protein